MLPRGYLTVVSFGYSYQSISTLVYYCAFPLSLPQPLGVNPTAMLHYHPRLTRYTTTLHMTGPA